MTTAGLAFAVLLVAAPAAGTSAATARTGHCSGLAVTVRAHRRSPRRRSCAPLAVQSLLSGVSAPQPALIAATAAAARLSTHGRQARLRKQVLAFGRALQAALDVLPQAASTSRAARARAAETGVGRTSTQPINRQGDNGTTMTGTETDEYPADGYVGSGKTIDMAMQGDGVSSRQTISEKAFMPRCPGKDGKSTGTVEADINMRAWSKEVIIVMHLHVSGTVTEQFDAQGQPTGTQVDLSFSDTQAIRGGSARSDSSASGTITNDSANASGSGDATTDFIKNAISSAVKGATEAAGAAIGAVRGTAAGSELQLTFSGSGTFDASNSTADGSTAHDDLSWSVRYDLERDRDHPDRLDPVGVGTMTSGPGSFRYSWPGFQVSCSGALQIPSSAPQPQIVPLSDNPVRLQVDSITAVGADGSSAFAGCTGAAPGTTDPYDASGDAAGLAADTLNLPYDLQPAVTLPPAIVTTGSGTVSLSTADLQQQPKTSCDDLFGTPAGTCTRSLQWNGTAVLAPLACPAAASARAGEATAPQARSENGG